MNIRTRGVQAKEKIGLTAGKASGKFGLKTKETALRERRFSFP
jgi:hypothetical protein